MSDKNEPNVIVINYKKQDNTKVILKTLAITRAVLLTAAAYLTFKKAVNSMFKKKEKDESKGE